MKKLISVIFGVLSIALVFSLTTSTNVQAQVVATQVSVVGFTRDLTVGSQGTDVTLLQNFLISKGYNIGGTATGYFGAQTKAALAGYQVSRGIKPADGYFGPVTRAAVQADQRANIAWPVPIYPVGCTSSVGYSSTTGLACNSSSIVTSTTQLTLSASPNPIPSASNVFNSYDGARGVSFTNFNVKSSGGDSSIVGVSASITASGTAPTTIYLYTGAGLVASKVITPGNNNVDFSNLNILVAKDTFQTLLIKGDFPANGNSGSMASVNINAVSYQSSNGILNKTSNGAVIGASQYFLKAAPKFVLATAPTASSVNNTSTGQTVSLTATFTMNVTSVGGTMVMPVPGDFTVKYGLGSLTNTTSIISVVTIPNNNIAEGSTANVTVTALVPASAIPQSGPYVFGITSIKYQVGQSSGIQNYGLEDFKTPNAVMAIVGGTATPTSSIKITSPNGGETWVRGTTQVVKWTDASVSTCPSNGGPICTPGFVTNYYDIKVIPTSESCQTRGVCTTYTIAKGATPDMNWFVGNNTETVGGVPDGQYNLQVCQQGTTNCDVSDSYFKIVSNSQPTITVVSPNGGETWKKGTTEVIRWKDTTPISSCGSTPGSTICTPAFMSPAYDIKLYKNQTCAISPCTLALVAPYTIAKNVYEGSYQWSVGKILDSGNLVDDGSYNIQVCKTGTNVCDMTDSYFKVVPGTSDSPITVISPNGGEVFEKGKKYNISWTTKVSSNVSEVQIGLVDTRVIADTDVREMTIAQKIPNTGSYSWTVPNSFGNLSYGKVDGKNYQIIVYPYNAGQGDSSDANFTITTSAQPYITIGSPNGGETWTRGTNQLIQWKYTDPNRGTCNTPGVYCTPEAPKLYDVKLLPNSQSCPVGMACAAVIMPYTIATNVSANSYNWNVGSAKGGIDDGGYTVQVCISGTTTCGTGLSYFKIVSTTQAKVTVKSPNGGETWTRGTSQNISFDYQYPTNVVGADKANVYFTVRLFPVPTPCYLENCAAVVSAPYSIANNVQGGFAWTVGKVIDSIGQAPDGAYYVEVCENLTSSCDKSDNYFKITSSPKSTITLTSPNDGGSYAVGTPLTISWKSSGTDPVYVNWYQDRDGDGSYETVYGLFGSTPQSPTGSLTWTVPSTIFSVSSINSRNKISVNTSAGSNSVSDMSDVPFAVTSTNPSASVTLTVNGSENPSPVAYESIMEVAWKTSGLDISKTTCVTTGSWIPSVGGGDWGDRHNLSPSGTIKLYAKHTNFGYTTPLQLDIQCYDGSKDYRDQVFVSVNPPVPTTSSPTAKITVNGGASATAYVGKTVDYIWSSSNADIAKSTYTSNCGSGDWNVNTTNGSKTSNLFSADQANCNYVLTFKVTQSSTGKTAESSVKINVLPAPIPTSSTPAPTPVPVPPKPPTGPNSPIGYLDVASCTVIAGWTCDADDYNAPLGVHIYDGANFVKFVGATDANLTREAGVGSLCGGNSKHGFSWATPQSLKDGKDHSIYAYGINTGATGNHAQLTNIKTLNCPASIAPVPQTSAVPKTTNTAAASKAFDWLFNSVRNIFK